MPFPVRFPLVAITDMQRFVNGSSRGLPLHFDQKVAKPALPRDAPLDSHPANQNGHKEVRRH